MFGLKRRLVSGGSNSKTKLEEIVHQYFLKLKKKLKRKKKKKNTDKTKA